MNRQQIMRECFRLALGGKGRVSPNPMVGAVLVRDGRIVARGYHREFGGPHAEVECLRHASGSMRDTTLYVSLEPCSYYGKTPPCTDLIVSRGVRSVVAAMEDPNPLVAGRGFRMLKQAGVRTSVGLLEDEARALNRVFATHIIARRPYVHMKIAESRDARITGGRSRWISSLESRKRVHAMRAEYDAVLVGAGTVRADDPTLTVRLVSGRQPDVIILDGSFSLPLNRKLFKRSGHRRVILLTTRSSVRQSGAKAKTLAARGIRVVGLHGRGKRLRIRQVLKELYNHNIASVLVEGGADVFSAFLSEGLVDELTLFIAPEVFGKGMTALQSGTMNWNHRRKLALVTVGEAGRDLMINVRFRQENH